MRIVSLLPAATEMVCALGARDELVGVSHECDYPESVRQLPVLTRARIDVSGSSRAIDRAVRDVIANALSLYAIDDEKLAELSPEIVITQDLCQLCAVPLDDVRAALARYAGRERVELVSLKPTRLTHVLDDIERLGTALGREATALELRRSLEQRMAEIAARARGAARRPRVATVEWLDPVMLGGTWMPDLVELAFGSAVAVTAGAPAPTVTAETLAALEPEVVVIKACGFSLARSLLERAALESAITPRLRANAAVYLTDGNAFFNRSGPRLVESLEILAAAMHPEIFPDFSSKHRHVLLRVR